MKNYTSSSDALLRRRFIVLMAMLMSLVALSIDIMLPALGYIGNDLQVDHPNDVQLIISCIFIGMGCGNLVFGPLSDSYGRKLAIYCGAGIFFIGCLFSIFAQHLELMLFGRMIQGIGAASCRVITVAMVRDRFSGVSMAKVMSSIMLVFILVPALAPSVGQLILTISHWRVIFILMLVFGIAATIWLYVDIEETLPKEKRLPFRIHTIVNGIKETASNAVARNYTIISTLTFGGFIGFLASSQQVLQEQYALGEYFAIAFGILALVLGGTSFVNAKLVESVGMITLSKIALIIMSLISCAFLLYSLIEDGHPVLIALMLYLAIIFSCFGILFGNVNAIALQPLGHIAGVANAVMSSVQTFFSAIIGGTIAYLYNDSVIPMVAGFFVVSALAIALMVVTRDNVTKATHE